MADVEAKFDLITRRLQETLGGDSIKAILAEGRTPKCYWGTSIVLTLCKGQADSDLPRYCADWTTYVNQG